MRKAEIAQLTGAINLLERKYKLGFFIPSKAYLNKLVGERNGKLHRL